MNPTTPQLADLRAAAHRDIDNLFDSWPHIIDAADAHFTTTANRFAQHYGKIEWASAYGTSTAGETGGINQSREPSTDQLYNETVGPQPPSKRKGEHADPTAWAALTPNPARQWSKQARHLLTQLHRITAAADLILGPPVCPQCNLPLTGHKTKRLAGVPYHATRCYETVRKRAQRNNVPVLGTHITAGHCTSANQLSEAA